MDYSIMLPFCRYIYKRLRFLGNKQVSWALSMLFIIVWHGLWPGYFLNFSLEMMLIMAERSVSGN